MTLILLKFCYWIIGIAMFFKSSQLRDFLKHLTDNYTILKLENWDSQNGIILRHDVDLDVSCAFEMAQIEAEYQAFGTYLFMTTHPSYNVSMLDNRRKLREMSDMGFEESKAESDIWMCKVKDHYDYVVRYVDDLAIMPKDPKSVTHTLDTTFGLTLKGTGPIRYHMGCDFFCNQNDVL